MLLDGIEELGAKKIQRAKSIEIGIINPNNAPILITENGCIAFDMNVCNPEVMRAIADLLDGKKPVKKKPIVEEQAPAVIKAKSKVKAKASKKVK